MLHSDLLRTALVIVLVIVSALLHELAHAAVAFAFGDDTAKQAGRLTLNPAAHLDPVGSVLIPFILAALGYPAFAYAKPVPYNPYKLKHRKYSEVLVALAGPAANFAQALLAAGILHVLDMSNAFYALPQDAAYVLLMLLITYISVNLSLMFFNLLPLPPLDGSKLLLLFLKGEAKLKYYRLQQYALPILFALIFFLPQLLHVDLLDWYFAATADKLFGLLVG